MNGTDLAFLLPAGLAGSAVVVYLAARARTSGRPAGAAGWAILFLSAAFLLLLAVERGGGSLRLGGLVLAVESPLGVLIGLLATGLGALACLFARDRVDPEGPAHLFHPLVVLAVAGVTGVALSRNLFTAFVMVEMSSVPSYALVAWRRESDPGAVPAALKYLLQGVAGTMTALLGLSLLYLQAGTLDLDRLPEALAPAPPATLALASALVLAGYGVKIGMVPLHTWLPDAYTRAPAPVTAVMAGATKTGVLVALFLTLAALPAGSDAGPRLDPVLGGAICALAVLTMTAGNLLALNQRDLRRVLAYSSVAQMGYVLLGFGIGLRWGGAEGFRAGLFYAVAYSVMKAGAFLGADLLAWREGTSDTLRLRGAGARSPVLGCALAVFLLGLIGVPATAGFPGKLLLLRSGMEAGTTAGVVLALALAANCLLSLGYYVPVLSSLLFRGRGTAGPAEAAGPALPAGATGAVLALAGATVALGIFPGLVDGWIVLASRSLAPGGAP